MSQAAADPLVGTMLGPCRLEALVGRGGMGRVYRARHVALDRVVALKLIDQATSAILLDAVLSEARAAAKLDDPHVVAVYEVGQDKGIPYIVLQWVEGEGLDARVRRQGPLAPPEALAIMREALTGLRAAHAVGLVHCDVKPANILVDKRGSVKLADFGIARQAGSSAGARETVSGSFHFMAPEQALGAPPDPRADLYAAGSTWYFALTGQMLFPGPAMDALMRHREEPPPDVRRLRPDVTERTSSLIRRMLAKDPGERPASADEVLKEMSAVGMLLNTDSSGSPFRILPPTYADPETAPIPADEVAVDPGSVTRPTPAAEARAAAPAKSFAPPPPPPPPDADVLGSRRTFFLLFGVIGVTVVGWPWRSAVFEDWFAGAVFLSSFPILFTFGARKSVWHKLIGVALGLGGAACFARYVGLGTPAASVPPLETMIVSALGAVCAGGGIYLGFWGGDSEEVLWGRVLSLLGAILLAVGGLTWGVPESLGWVNGLQAAAPRVWGAWWSAGGLWRWGGLAGLGAAAAAARRLKTVSAKPADRNLNWNK